MKFKFESFKEADESLVYDIRKLESLCNISDGTSYSLFIENAFNADKTIDFIYTARVNSELISLIILFFPDKKDVEVYGFTHPAYRRRGLFSKLIELTHNQLKKLGDYSHLFVCDPSCKMGLDFLEHRGLVLEETEYMMTLKQYDFNKYRESYVNRENILVLKRAGLEDLNYVSAIASIMYDEERENAADFIRETIKSEKREQLTGWLNGSIVGICSVGREEDYMMINGLGIDKSFQGRGLGRDMLNQVLGYTFQKFQSDIKLEVSSVNAKAYNLYKSVGFKQKESYGYYRSVKS